MKSKVDFAFLGWLVESIEEQYFIFDMIYSLRPTLGVLFIVAICILDVVNDIHFCTHDIEMNHSACSGHITPSVGEKEHPHGIVVVVGKVFLKMFSLVVLIIADDM